MSKNKIEIDVKVDDNGTTAKLALDSKKAAAGLDGVSKGAGTADRNMKGAAQASSNSTKNFSKMAQGMGGLVGVYATVAAQAFAVTAAFDFLKRSMDFKNLIEGQKALGSITGVAYKTISNSLVEATNGQLKYAEAAKAAAIGTASGISPTQLARLGSAAKNASIALGRDLGDSFDRLIRGVTKAEPELLDELGIILRLENATNKYGLKIGKAAKDLNEFERSQAVANEVLEQSERKFGAMEKMMDPTAHSLNQFAKAFDDVVNQVKMGIAGPLAGIATFLSENIYALIGSLSLFAASILKQILPSMSAWKASSMEAAVAAKQSQVAIREEIDKTRLAYIALQKAQTTGVSKMSTESLSDMKGTKTGTGAVDFLRGSTDSKAAQNAANKALNTAETQLADSAKKRTGILKHMNAAQVADLRASYNARAAIIKKGEAQFKLSITGMKLSWKSFVLSIKAGAATIKVAFASIGAAAATLGRILSKAFFWLSMIAIAYDVFKMAKDYFFPVSEATQKLNKDTEALTDKYKTLSEEIGRTNAVMNEYNTLTTKERIVARGNQAASLDIEALVKDINSLDKSAEKYEELKAQLLTTTKQAIQVDASFKVLYDTVKNGTKISDDQAKSLLNTSNHLQSQKVVLEQLTATSQATDAEFVKLVGTFSKPFGTALLSSLQKEILNTSVAMQATGEELFKLRQQQNVFEGTEKDAAALATAIKEAEESLGGYSDKIQLLGKFQQGLVDKQVQINKLLNDQSNAATEAAKQRTVGITYDQKTKNLAADALILAQSSNDEKAKLILLQTKESVLLEKQADANKSLTSDEEQQLAVLQLQITEQKNAYDIAEAQRKVGEAQNNIAQGTLTLQHQLNLAMEKRLALSNAVTEAERKLAFIKAGGTGTYGFARATEGAFAERSILNKKRAEAAADVTSTQGTYETQKKRFQANEIDLAAMTQATQQKDAAAARMASINQEITLFERRAESVLLNSQAETELLRATYEGISLNPAVTEFNKQIVDLKSKGIELSRVQQESLYAEIEAQTVLQQSMQMKQELFSSLTSNITSAFTSIVDGTKSAKQAFGDMAIAILADITRMVIQMMIMRVLMSAFGPSFGGSDAGMTDFAAMNNFSNVARYGGVFADGAKVPGYAVGGIASGPQAGYPVALHGTEAVVPLPNGRSIPVEMSGTNQNNNVVVNVSIDDKGNSTSNTQSQSSMDAGKLGSAVAKAVQEELQNQKRSGGILNPYGAA